MRALGVGIFVKTPGLSPVKTRLAEAIGRERAEELHLLCARATQAVALEAWRLRPGRFAPHWAIAEAEGIASPHWRGLPSVAQGEGPLAARLHRVYTALRDRHGGAALIGADCPQMRVEALVAALETIDAEPERFVIGPARDGGFYLFAGSAPVAETSWQAVTYSTERTAAELVVELGGESRFALLPMERDLDEARDLGLIRQELEAREATLLREQARLLQRLRELGV